jgi:hypothetical protein
MDADPFINALAGVDVLKVEAVGRVIGCALGAVYVGMVDAGVPATVANDIIDNAVDSAFAEITKMAKDQGERT